MDNLIRWNFCASCALTDIVSFNNHIHMAYTEQHVQAYSLGKSAQLLHVQKSSKQTDIQLETYETVTHLICNTSNCVHSSLICSAVSELSVARRRDRRIMALISPFLCYAWVHHWRRILLSAEVSVKDIKGLKRPFGTVKMLLLKYDPGSSDVVLCFSIRYNILNNIGINVQRQY